MTFEDYSESDFQRTRPRLAIGAGASRLVGGLKDRGTTGNLPLDVGGKTATAQLGTEPAHSHAWIIGFAGPEGKEPTIAIAVIVEGQPGASEQTGGRVAAPIAQAVLSAYLNG